MCVSLKTCLLCEDCCSVKMKGLLPCEDGLLLCEDICCWKATDLLLQEDNVLLYEDDRLAA